MGPALLPAAKSGQRSLVVLFCEAQPGQDLPDCLLVLVAACQFKPGLGLTIFFEQPGVNDLIHFLGQGRFHSSQPRFLLPQFGKGPQSQPPQRAVG